MPETPAEKDERKQRESEAKARQRVDKARQEHQTERDLHLATVKVEAEKSKSELDTLLSLLPEPEQRSIRLMAYELVLKGEWDAGHLQSRVDDMALRLARYAIEGKV